MQQKIVRILLGKNWLGVLFHLVLIFSISYMLINYFFNGYLQGYTRHGQTVEVPNLERMTIEEVDATTKKLKLRYQIQDTIYSPRFPRLTVVKQQPLFGEKVKQDRRIYITINAANPPLIIIDSAIYDKIVNKNSHGVISTWVNELGMKEENIEIKFVSGPYEGLVRACFVAGKQVEIGDSYSIESKLTIEVDDGGISESAADSLHGFKNDSTGLDSVMLGRFLDWRNQSNLSSADEEFIKKVLGKDSTNKNE